MVKGHLEECIQECESAMSHLDKALKIAQPEARQKMQHAVSDLKACISSCRAMM